MKPFQLILSVFLLASLALGQTVTNGGPVIKGTPMVPALDSVGSASAPSNPASGNCRGYFNTSTGLMAYVNSSGGNCGPTGTGFSNPENLTVPGSALTLPGASSTSFGIGPDGFLSLAPNGIAHYSDAITMGGYGGTPLYSSDYIWSFPATSPASLTGGTPATVTIPCPRGIDPSFLLVNTDTITGDYWIDISGTGTAEAVYVTATTCTSTSNGASGTITFTPANSHSAGYVVGSATSGIQEAINAGEITLSTSPRNVTVIVPDTRNVTCLNIDGPIETHGNFISIVSGGGARLCQTFLGMGIILGDTVLNNQDYFYNFVRGITILPHYSGTAPQINLIQSVTNSGAPGPCTWTVTYTGTPDFKVGQWIVNTGNLNLNTIAGIWQVVTVPGGNQVTFSSPTCSAITGSVYAGGNSVAAYLPLIDTLSQGMGLYDFNIFLQSGYNGYHYGLVMTTDEEPAIHNLQTSASAFRQSTSEWNSAIVYGPGGPGNAAILDMVDSNLEGSSLGPACIDWQSGNDVRLTNVVCQNFYPYGIRLSRRRGNSGTATLNGIHFESACNTSIVNAGCSEIIDDGMNLYMDAGSEGDAGGVPSFGTNGAANLLWGYFIVPVSSSSDSMCSTQPNDQRCLTSYGNGPVLPIGTASADSSSGGTFTTHWWAIPGATSYVLLRSTYSSPNSAGSIPYGTGNYEIAGSINPLTACTDQYCSYTDSVGLTPTSYTVPAYGPASYAPYVPMEGAAGIWLGQLADTALPGNDPVFYNGPVPANAPVMTENLPGQNVITLTTPASWQAASGVFRAFTYFGGQITPNSGAAPGNALMLPIKSTNIATNDSSSVSNVKGIINFGTQMTTLVTPVDVMTLWDCNYIKTLSTFGNRPSNDACDTFISLDSYASSGNVTTGSGAGLAFGSNKAISFYLGHIADNSSYKMQLTSTGLNVVSGLTVGTVPAGCTSGLAAGATVCGASAVATGVSTNTDGLGALTLSSGTVTYTFVGTYAVHPICFAHDLTTAATNVGVSYTSTTSVTFTAGTTDNIEYFCGVRK